MSTQEAVEHERKSRDLARRAIVGAIMVPIVASMVVVDARISALLFAVAAAIACREYYGLVFATIPRSAWLAIVSAALLPLCPILVQRAYLGSALFGLIVGTSTLVWISCLFSKDRPKGPEQVGHIMAGLLFCSGGPIALSALRSGRDGVAWTTIVLVAAWTNDAVAYFVGRAIGRNHLWPAVSPHKTWEGFLAGLGGGVVALLLLHPWLSLPVSFGACVALGVCAGLCGPLGDLCKSMLKRAYHVKDTSQLFPGHGGMLDRIDSLLFFAPVVWLVRTFLWPR